MAGKSAAKPKAASKSEIIAAICEDTGLATKDVKSVLESLGKQVEKAVAKKGVGLFKLPGVMQVKVTDKPAQPARRGIDPFTKQERDYPAKPASRKVKILPLKQLRDAAK